jgi:putative spermidine/putrescine transport system ATP-binding protein
MTVAENVAFPLSVRGVSKSDQRERAHTALSMVKLERYGARKPAQLSGGQQQRVALARALVFEPKIVLMDEPLGALDKQLREHMQLEIKHLHQRLGVTVVYVTHDQSEALTMSDRIAVFNDGVVQQLDTPSGLYDRPQNSFVAGFIGENNKLNGIVEALEDGGLCRVRMTSGELLQAQAVNVGGVGAKTTVSFRPEKIHIDGTREGNSNRLHGKVLETIYHGDHCRLRVAVAGNEDFMVKMRYRSERPTPAAGEAIELAFPAQDCLALDPVK